MNNYEEKHEYDVEQELEAMLAQQQQEAEAAIEASGVDFTDGVELPSGVSYSEPKDGKPAKADVILDLPWVAENNLIERTDLCERVGLSTYGIRDAQMAGEDIRVTLYGICDAEQNVSLEIVLDGGSTFYETAEAPLSDSEKASLKQAMESAAQALYQESLMEFMFPETHLVQENNKPEITDNSFEKNEKPAEKKKNSVEFDR